MLHHKLSAAVAAVLLCLLGFAFFGPPSSAAQDAAVERVGVAAATAPAAPDAQPTAAVREVAGTAPSAAAPATADKPADESAGAMRTGALVVRLRGTDGAALVGFGVGARPLREMTQPGQSPEFTPTDARGEVTFGALAPGGWLIDIDRANPVAAEVRAGETTERVIAVPDGIAVTGEVVDAADRPVPAARILVIGSRLGAPALTRADTAGRFRVDHLAPGLELQACAPGHAPSVTERVVGKAGEQIAVRLRLGAGGFRVLGRVLDADGRPLVGAAVAVLPAAASRLSAAAMQSSGIRAAWLRTDADGRFASDEVGAGAHVVVAQAGDGSSPPCWRQVDPSRGEEFVELRTPRGASVHGRVLRDGQPVAGTVIYAWFGDAAADAGYLANLLGMRQAVADADGRFRVTGMLAGAVSLRAIGPTETLKEERLVLADGAQQEWNVRLSSGTGLRIELQPAAAGEQHGLWALIYTVGAPDSTGPGIVPLTNRDGAGTWTGDRSGTVDIVITMMHGRDVVQIAARRGIAASESKVVFTLRPEDLPTRTIRGRLVDAQQAPIAQATITAARSDGAGLVVRRETTTDANGAFAIGPLPAGTYLLLQGEPTRPQRVGEVVVAGDRDEDVGDLTGGQR